MGHVEFRNDAEAMAFAWMIAKAAWAPVCVRYKDRKIELERGQLAISQRDMARALDRDKGWIERLWRRLQNAAMIKADSKAGVAVITICNYGEYQASEDADKAPRKARYGAGARQAQGTEQRIKEDKEVKKDIPNGISGNFSAPQPEWMEFAKHRKAIGNPLTPHGVKLALAKLQRLADDGHDPRAVINQTIENGWTGLFPVKQERMNGHARNGQGDRTLAAAEGAFGPASQWTDDTPF